LANFCLPYCLKIGRENFLAPWIRPRCWPGIFFLVKKFFIGSGPGEEEEGENGYVPVNFNLKRRRDSSLDIAASAAASTEQPQHSSLSSSLNVAASAVALT
jgi:hypothetical protein